MNRILISLVLFYSVSCIAEVQPIDVLDFTITNTKTDQSISLMDYRSDHTFFTENRAFR